MRPRGQAAAAWIVVAFVCFAARARADPGELLPDSVVSTISSESAPVPIARDVVVSISALGGAIVAFLGVNAWRRQLRGTTEYKIALRILEASYALREAMIEARSRMIFPESAGPRGGMGPAEFAVLRAARLYQRRLARVGKARADLLLSQQQALAVWGDPAQRALADLFDAVEELFSVCDRYYEDAIARARQLDRGAREEERGAESLAFQRILYSRPVRDGKDPFGERIARAITKAETFYRGRLK